MLAPIGRDIRERNEPSAYAPRQMNETSGEHGSKGSCNVRRPRDREQRIELVIHQRGIRGDDQLFRHGPHKVQPFGSVRTEKGRATPPPRAKPSSPRRRPRISTAARRPLLVDPIEGGSCPPALLPARAFA
jgi:hypothetical protein